MRPACSSPASIASPEEESAMTIPLIQLWLPLLLSAVAVFIVSSLVHMVLKWHASDYHGLANEDEVLAAVRRGAPAAGIYMFPYCKDMKDLGTPEMLAKFRQGPTGKMILRAGADPSMGKPLLMWFVFCLVVSLFCALLAAHALAAGALFGQVFCVTGLAAFMGYGFGSFVQGIWWGQPWGAVAKDAVDAVLYALATAAVFAWLWPH
jgi:hypothetical protein